MLTSGNLKHTQERERDRHASTGKRKSATEPTCVTWQRSTRALIRVDPYAHRAGSKTRGPTRRFPPNTARHVSRSENLKVSPRPLGFETRHCTRVCPARGGCVCERVPARVGNLLARARRLGPHSLTRLTSVCLFFAQISTLTLFLCELGPIKEIP